jgi:rhamnosyltransferase
VSSLSRKSGSARVCAVVVTYHPDPARLAEVLGHIEAQVDHTVVIDNTRFNRGLAAAQNDGIALARAGGATHVLLLDQDSVPQPGMTGRLLAALRRLQARGVRVACVGPRLRCYGSDCRARAECDVLISSGSLIPMAVLDEVGGMEEAFFIDQVDTEWCLRARALGYRVFGVREALLDHRPGESMSWVWLGSWRRLIRHPPFRYYTIFRNTLVLCRRQYAIPRFVAFQLCWLAALFVAFGLLGRRNGTLPMMLRGIADGAVSCKTPGSALRPSTTSPPWQPAPSRRRSAAAPAPSARSTSIPR